MSKLQIRSIQRPPKPSPPEPIAAKGAVSNATPAAEPTAQKKIIPSPATKPPQYQAIGVVRGTLLLMSGNRNFIEGEDGHRLKIFSIRDQKLLLWMLRNPDQWQGKSAEWRVYPGKFGYELAGYGAGLTGLEPGEFVVSGNCMQLDGAIAVKVCRNNPKDKSFSLINVAGSIPGLVDGEIRRLQCRLEGDRLVMVEG
jgi:hypothetical protein